MIERILLILWGAWLLFVLIAAFRVIGFNIARRRQDRKWADKTRNQRPTAVIVAVKGFDPRATPRFFDTLFAQDYANYRVIVCFESWQDPVAVWLREELELREDAPVWDHPDSDANLSSITLVCAGISSQEGQKVHNQIAAFGHLSDKDEVIAFVDADVIFQNDWLASLTAPINLKTHPLSTTYRWLVPKRPTLPNQIASVINGSITTQGGSERTNVLWGGSMAIARSVFDKLDVAKLFSGSLNDDLRLSKAARKDGNRIAFVRSLILPTVIDFTWKSFFEFAKRQYTQVKFFSPILYTGTNIVLGFYILGLVSIVAALIYGYFNAWIPIAAAYVIDQIRALARQQVYLGLFEENGIRQKLFAAGWLEHMLTPFWMCIHWLLLVSTWTQSRITWAGIRYRIQSNSKTQILDRPTVAERLPAGVAGLSLIAGLHDKKRRGYTRPVPTIPMDTGDDASLTAETPGLVESSTTKPEPEVAATPPAEETLETAAGRGADSSGVEEFGSIDDPSKGDKITADTADTADTAETAETAEKEPSAVPPGHPGLSNFVTRLAAAPRFNELRAARAAKLNEVTDYSLDQVAAAKNKSRTPASKHYPVFGRRPESTPPSGTSTPLTLTAPTPESAAPPAQEKEVRKVTGTANLNRSFAAHRQGVPAGYRSGDTIKRASRSSRATQASSASRCAITPRPVSNKASGRP
ncbi:glycosyltransferase [Verrucomicrobiales bacterium BCK34]|nr:glycosyltransferase [Verrucomicrobiales bacterium BCK34]